MYRYTTEKDNTNMGIIDTLSDGVNNPMIKMGLVFAAGLVMAMCLILLSPMFFDEMEPSLTNMNTWVIGALSGVIAVLVFPA